MISNKVMLKTQVVFTCAKCGGPLAFGMQGEPHPCGRSVNFTIFPCVACEPKKKDN